MYGVNKNYLLSDNYINEMMQHYGGNHDDFINFLYDADPKTDNYNWRHFQLVQKLGGWRWKGIFTYRKTFVDLIYNKSLKGISITSVMINLTARSPRANVIQGIPVA